MRKVSTTAKKHFKIAWTRCREKSKLVRSKESYEKIIHMQTLLELGHRRLKSLNSVSVELGGMRGSASCDLIVRS